MNKFITNVLPFFAALLISSSALAATELTKDEFYEAVVGNTISGRFDGTKYKEYYYEEDGQGRVTGSYARSPYTGTWEYADNGCIMLKITGDANCWRYFKHKKEGKLKLKGPSFNATVKVEEGNTL